MRAGLVGILFVSLAACDTTPFFADNSTPAPTETSASSVETARERFDAERAERDYGGVVSCPANAGFMYGGALYCPKR